MSLRKNPASCPLPSLVGTVCAEKPRQEVARVGNKQPTENALEEYLIDHPRGTGPHLLTMLLGLVSGH